VFAVPEALNPYDNEPPDINGDGVQLYVRTQEGDAGWLLLPIAGTDVVRVRRIESWSAAPVANEPIAATWQPKGAGYVMRIDIPGDAVPAALDVIVNEMPRGRERRRGQLVMSGAAREFTYLRGDRHEPARLVPLRLIDA
jgi:hypothetical protein